MSLVKRVYLKSPPPVVFPYEQIERTPSVEEVRNMARRLPWKEVPTVYKKSRVNLRHLLEELPLVVNGVTLEAPRFTARSDPYVLYRQCLELDNSNTTLRKRGKWLSSVARLLICWVAEELKRKGWGLDSTITSGRILKAKTVCQIPH